MATELTDAEGALENIFRRDMALKGGGPSRPSKTPTSPTKTPLASPEVQAAEQAAFLAFIYNNPDRKGGANEKPPLAQKPDLFVSSEAKALDNAAMNALVSGDPSMHKLREKADDMIINDTFARSGDIQEKGIVGTTYKRAVKVGPLKAGSTRRNTAIGGDIVTSLLTIRNQVKLYHWQTKSFARHKATDDLTTALDTNIDTFVEIYMGRYGRPKISKSIKLHNFSEEASRTFVVKQTKYMSNELPRKIKKTDTDLLNLRDTILGDLNKVLYLFTLT